MDLMFINESCFATPAVIAFAFTDVGAADSKEMIGG
jgi:hypothetical protein